MPSLSSRRHPLTLPASPGHTKETTATPSAAQGSLPTPPMTGLKADGRLQPFVSLLCALGTVLLCLSIARLKSSNIMNYHSVVRSIQFRIHRESLGRVCGYAEMVFVSESIYSTNRMVGCIAGN